MLILYIRLGCHLCDEAFLQLQSLGIFVKRVNIDRDAELKAQYNWLVPVLYDPQRDAELIYPFSCEDIVKFIENQ